VQLVNPVTHLLLSWTIAEPILETRRDRALVALAGIAPDADGAGILVDLARGVHPSEGLYAAFHHILAHNLMAGMVVALAAFALARRRAACAALALVAFHLHLLGDLVGSAGPGGSVWTLSYLYPFSEQEFAWQGQWELNAWPNLVITALLIVAAGAAAVRRGRSPLELVSRRADAALVAALRRRFGGGATPRTP
jgi:hypothetical protein